MLFIDILLNRIENETDFFLTITHSVSVIFPIEHFRRCNVEQRFFHIQCVDRLTLMGADLVRDMIKKGIASTIHVRSELKAITGHLSVVVDTYSTIDAYSNAIDIHTRLFPFVLII